VLFDLQTCGEVCYVFFPPYNVIASSCQFQLILAGSMMVLRFYCFESVYMWCYTAYLSELRRDFLASVGITYAVFRIAKSRLRGFGKIY
jgi:hypothetical protein